MKMGVFDSQGVILIDKNFWGVFFGNKTIVFEPQYIRKPLNAKDAYKTTFFHILKNSFKENSAFKGVFGVFDV